MTRMFWMGHMGMIDHLWPLHPIRHSTMYLASTLHDLAQFFFRYKGTYKYKQVNSPRGPLCFYSPYQNFIHSQGSIWTTLRSTVLDRFFKNYLYNWTNYSWLVRNWCLFRSVNIHMKIFYYSIIFNMEHCTSFKLTDQTLK